MKSGTPEQLAKARTKTKKAKEKLEDLTGANRELYGALGGGTLGALLGALAGKSVGAAIGAVGGGLLGSLVMRPSLVPEEPERVSRRRGRDDDDEDVIPFPRYARARARNRRGRR
jgi:uncharacterized protein YcfJ